MGVTGHRNEMSLKAYSDVDVDEHKKISGILSDQSSQLQSSSQHYCYSNSSVEHLPSTTTASSSNSYPSAYHTTTSLIAQCTLTVPLCMILPNFHLSRKVK